MFSRLNNFLSFAVFAIAAAAAGNPAFAAAGAGTISLADASYPVAQGAGSTVLTVNRTGGTTGAINVYWDTKGGTAVAGVDYWNSAGHLIWQAGDATPKSITIPLGKPAPFSGTRTFTVSISVLSGGAVLGAISTAAVNITGSLGAGAGTGTLQIAPASYTAAQTAASVKVSVSRVGGASGTAKVYVATQSGSAIAGTNFTPSSTWLTWKDGDSAPKSFPVALKSAAAYTGAKTFTVLVAYPDGASLGSPTAATVSITGTATTTPVDVTVAVTPTSTKPISPYIYGINGPALFGALPVPYASVTLNRLGGDRWTAYNWQNNYSNAGSDYLYENDQGLSTSTAPLAAITPTIDTDRTSNVATLITVPMQGYVAGDDSGPVSLTNPIQTSRFKTVVYAKGSAFTTAPSNTNASVYDDEMVWALDQHYAGLGIFSSTPAIPPVLIELDNEPDIWNSTHQEVQTSSNISYSDFFAKSIALSTAIKKQFPQATLFGPANYGYTGFYDWQNGSWTGATVGGYNWFLDGYLTAVDTAAKSAGNSLVDVYSLHWYSSATDSSGNQVTNLTGSTLSADSVQAIVQSPRSLWDPTYVEKSWITADTSIGAIRLVPRVLDKIAHAGSGNAYAVSKMAITEYFNGGDNHIAGTLAQADNLGVFGAQGLYAATLWPLGTAPYTLGAFASFRNFDGAGHSFGNNSVAASSSNIANVAAYVSTDSTRPGRVVMVLINRSVSAQTTAITGQPLTGTAHLFQTTAASASAQGKAITPVAAGTQAVSGSSITVTLPALSVTTIDIY